MPLENTYSIRSQSCIEINILAYATQLKINSRHINRRDYKFVQNVSTYLVLVLYRTIALSQDQLTPMFLIMLILYLSTELLAYFCMIIHFSNVLSQVENSKYCYFKMFAGLNH